MAVGVAPPVRAVPVKASEPYTVGPSSSTMSVLPASLTVSFTWPSPRSVTWTGRIFARSSSLAWRWSRRSTAVPGWPTSKRAICLLRSEIVLMMLLASVTFASMPASTSVCTWARRVSASCSVSVRMPVFCRSVWRAPEGFLLLLERAAQADLAHELAVLQHVAELLDAKRLEAEALGALGGLHRAAIAVDDALAGVVRVVDVGQVLPGRLNGAAVRVERHGAGIELGE